jgi:hypothetical protein
LASCLRLKLTGKDFYEMPRISQVALRQGVPEGIEGLLESLPPDQVLQNVRPSVDLPAKEEEALQVLRVNLSKWQWDAQRKKFTLPPAASTQPQDAATR